MPPFVQDFFPTGKRAGPRAQKKRKGAGFPNRNGSRTKRKALRPCGAVCVCEGGPQAGKRRFESLQRGPRPVYATALSHWRRSLAGADTCRNDPELRAFLRVFPGWKLRPRQSAQVGPSGRVCPCIPCPSPRSRKFWALLRNTAYPLVCEKNSRIRISGPGGPQTARSGSYALPVPWHPTGSDRHQEGQRCAPWRPAAAPPVFFSCAQ